MAVLVRFLPKMLLLHHILAPPVHHQVALSRLSQKPADAIPKIVLCPLPVNVHHAKGLQHPYCAVRLAPTLATPAFRVPYHQFNPACPSPRGRSFLVSLSVLGKLYLLWAAWVVPQDLHIGTTAWGRLSICRALLLKTAWE